MQQEIQGLKDIAKLVFRFGKIDRATLYDDGVTKESDTDHTVMLSICACSLAEKLYPNLDLGKVAQFAIVHDLVEVYAGDTVTFNISKEEKMEKEKREHDAFLKIKDTFGNSFAWITETIQNYELLASKEAQFVKLVDKIMTKLTHLVNEGAFFKRIDVPKEETKKHFDAQFEEMNEKYGTLFPEVLTMLKYLMDDILQKTYDGIH